VLSYTTLSRNPKFVRCCQRRGCGIYQRQAIVASTFPVTRPPSCCLVQMVEASARLSGGQGELLVNTFIETFAGLFSHSPRAVCVCACVCSCACMHELRQGNGRLNDGHGDPDVLDCLILAVGRLHECEWRKQRLFLSCVPGV